MKHSITPVAKITMTSLELVEFINSQRGEDEAELRHDHFMAKVPKVLGDDAPKFSGTSFYSGNGSAKIERAIYIFPKREACLMAMSYSYELQAKVFDRMTELEEAIQGKVESAGTNSAIASAREFRALFGIARLIGCDKNVAAISANQAVAKITGTNVLNLLGQQHLEAENQSSLYFTPTELGSRINVSARKFNMLLAEAGLQAKNGEHWTPLAASDGLVRILDTGKRHGNGTAVQQLKWSDSVLSRLAPNEAA